MNKSHFSGWPVWLQVASFLSVMTLVLEVSRRLIQHPLTSGDFGNIAVFCSGCLVADLSIRFINKHKAAPFAFSCVLSLAWLAIALCLYEAQRFAIHLGAALGTFLIHLALLIYRQEKSRKRWKEDL